VSEETEELEKKFRKEWEAYKKERNERLHRFFVRVLVIFAVLGLTVSATAYFTWHTAKESKDGLCALRQDAERRVTLGEEFVKDHPNGFAGISRASLEQSIRNAKQTTSSLSNLSCQPAKTS
jgi:hypothetical protein